MIHDKEALVSVGLLRDHVDCIFQLASWLYETWFEAEGSSVEEAVGSLFTRLNKYALPLTFVALVDQKPVGMVSLAWQPGPNRQQLPCLVGLFVAPHARNRGVGRRLCQHATQHAQRLKLKRLFLYTPDCVSYYARQGWTRVGTATRVKTSQPCVLMSRKLD